MFFSWGWGGGGQGGIRRNATPNLVLVIVGLVEVSSLRDMWAVNNVWSTQQQLSSSLLSTVSITDLPSFLLSGSAQPVPAPAVPFLHELPHNDSHRLLRQGHFHKTKDSVKVLLSPLFGVRAHFLQVKVLICISG